MNILLYIQFSHWGFQKPQDHKQVFINITLLKQLTNNKQHTSQFKVFFIFSTMSSVCPQIDEAQPKKTKKILSADLFFILISSISMMWLFLGAPFCSRWLPNQPKTCKYCTSKCPFSPSVLCSWNNVKSVCLPLQWVDPYQHLCV